MRAFALLFGALATLALGCVAQMAVQSSGVDPRPDADRTLWYGGMLETLRIVGDGSGGPAIAMLGAPPESRTTQCHDPSMKSRRTTGAVRRPQLGVEM